jgi:hypothetical protein
MKKKFILFLFLVPILLNRAAFSCTGFIVANDEYILIGNNEDYYPAYTDTVVRVRPASEGSYGCLLVGFNRQNFAMGGINDQGLFFDSFSVPECNWVSFTDKEDFPGFRLENILEVCVTVEDVIAFCRRYNLPYFTNNHLFVADRAGKAAVIEWGDGDIDVIWKQGDVQVVTNFFLLHPERGWHPCWRFDTASTMLSNTMDISWELFRSILDAVHVESSAITQYSNIYELHNGNLYFFNNHNFDEYLKFNISEELEKGRNDYQVPAHMSEIMLRTPENEQVIDSSRVEFSWRGKSVSRYLLYYSTDSDFTDCEPIEVRGHYTTAAGRSGMALIFLGMLPLGFVFKSRKKRIMGAVLVLTLTLTIVVFITYCNTSTSENNPEPIPEYQEFSAAVENLQPNSIYYWKITANATETLTSESVVRSFTTE